MPRPAPLALTVLPRGAVQNLSELQQGIVSGFLLIFFSELGDKTFFIALLLSLKQAKPVVFAGTFGALAIMTVISARPASAVGLLTQMQACAHGMHVVQTLCGQSLTGPLHSGRRVLQAGW